MFKKNLQKLINIFESSSINYIEISSFWGFKKIKLGKNKESITQNNPLYNPNNHEDHIKEASKPPQDTFNTESNDRIITSEANGDIRLGETLKILSPLVGTFYLSPKPGSPPFISEGDMVNVGQTLCIIEAMKIFNEIESEHDGKIVKILVDDGTPIEYDQPLMILKK